MDETEPPKMKPRPIVRLGIFFISHYAFFSVICYSAGVLALLLLPIFAMNTYISENALMPGSANSMISNHEVSQANNLVNDLNGLNTKPGSRGWYVYIVPAFILLPSKNKGKFVISVILIEGVVRSVNNLLEKFHQSFFLYLIISTSKFVSVGVYMIAFALLVAPLPAVAASLYSYANNLNLTSENVEPARSENPDDHLIAPLGSWKWLSAAKNVFVVHLLGAVVSLVPFFISKIPTSLVGVLLSPFVCTRSSQQLTQEWAFLKAMTISAAFIGLCLMSVINFATAEIGAFFIVPMCLMAHPLKIDIMSGSIKTLSRAACNLVLGFIAFPPITFFLLKVAFQGSNNQYIGDFLNWMRTLSACNSATFLYLGMIHLPCWVLCVQILFHHC